jgi:HEAT repeat protein
MKFFRVTAIFLPIFVAIPVCTAGDDQLKEDEKLLEEAKIAITGDGLCEFFRKNTPVEADLKRVPELIAKLSNDDFEVRDNASQALVALGPPITQLLKKHLDQKKPEPDLETKTRLRTCIEKIESTPTAEWACAAARLMRDRKPKGGVDALLTYLPWATSDDAENEIVLSLLALGTSDGKVHASLVAAMKDTAEAKRPCRAAAALVLARAGDTEQKKLAEQALKDTDASIRFRAAQGFVAGKDKTAVPVLLALLTEAPLGVAEKADDLLVRIAGESPPSASLGSKDEERKKCREAWEAWSKKNYDSLDLSKVDVMTASTPAAMAKDTVRKFADAGVNNDVAKLEKTLDEQINVMGIITIARKDLVEQFKNAPKTDKPVLGPIKTLKIEDVAKTSAEAKAFIESYKKDKIQAVSMEITEGGRKQEVILVLRMTGGKMLIAGMLVPMP